MRIIKATLLLVMHKFDYCLQTKTSEKNLTKSLLINFNISLEMI